jgi:hypothetical protein
LDAADAAVLLEDSESELEDELLPVEVVDTELDDASLS